MPQAAERAYEVEGMTCSHCELSVTEEVAEVAGVESVRADRTTGKVYVGGDVAPGEVRAAIERAGYAVAA